LTTAAAPARFHFVVGVAVAVILAAAAWSAFGATREWLPVLLAWLLGINVATIGYFGFDKRRARRGGTRVPERALHGLALVGGSPGAILGGQLFRHKTVKTSFRVVLWLIVAVQAAAIAWLVWRARR
jgi:uncharacterized membrane protein YsdA (DUF1294 family)